MNIDRHRVILNTITGRRDFWKLLFLIFFFLYREIPSFEAPEYLHFNLCGALRVSALPINPFKQGLILKSFDLISSCQ